ncbi:MAG: hypothetical protein JNL74_05240, partial [Fibrobacteres bacterium]|nr:hypothetical protein [Fibrobacterota bacterium]
SYSYWSKPGTFWHPDKDQAYYYADPVNRATTPTSKYYLINNDYVWDETSKSVKTSTLYGSAATANKQKRANYFDATGDYVVASVANTDRDMVYIGTYDLDTDGWLIPVGQRVEGGIKTTTSPSTITLATARPTASAINGCIVEFDAYSHNLTSTGVIKISGLDAAGVVTRTEEFRCPNTKADMGKMEHFMRKTKISGVNIRIELPTYVFFDNLMIYPDSAKVSLVSYDAVSKLPISTSVSGGGKAVTFYATDGLPLGQFDKKGSMYSWGHTWFARDLSGTDNYNPAIPNVSEKVSFPNGNMIPEWSFEKDGALSASNTAPYWVPYWTSTLSMVYTKYLYGKRALQVTPGSSYNDGICMDFISDQKHPQFSAMIGKTVTFSCWIMPTVSTSYRIGLDCTDDQVVNVRSVTANQWNYIKCTFRNVKSRMYSQASNDYTTPRIRFFVREENATQNAVFYVDGAVLELGETATHPMVIKTFSDAIGNVLQVHNQEFNGDQYVNSYDSVKVVMAQYDAKNRPVSNSLPVRFPYTGITQSPNGQNSSTYLGALFLTSAVASQLDACYGLAQNPYSLKCYYEDGTNRVKETSIPGPNNYIGDGTRDEYFYYTASSISPAAITTNSVLSPVLATTDDGKYRWNIVKKLEQFGVSNYYHSITDYNGNTVLSYITKNSENMGANNVNLVSMTYMEYDKAGNPKVQYAPSNFTAASDRTKVTNVLVSQGSKQNNTVDMAGRVLATSNSDMNGEKWKRFSKTGMLRFLSDPNHRAISSLNYIAYTYNSRGQLYRVLDITAKTATDFDNQTYIDNPKWPALATDVTKLSVLVENEYDTYGRLYKSRTYSIVARNPVEVEYLYDEDNQVRLIIERIPDNKGDVFVQEHAYTYTTTGQVDTYYFKRKGAVPVSFTRKMTYDLRGRLDEVTTVDRNGTAVNADEISYQYNDPRGLVTKTVHPNATFDFTQTNTYDVQGKLTNLDVSSTQKGSLFSEEIAYDKTALSGNGTVSLTPQFNGNIAGVRYTGVNPNGNGEVFKYNYDELNRLTVTGYTDESGANPNGYYSMQSYYPDGQIKSNEKYNPWYGWNKASEYQYPTSSSHQLQGLSGDYRGPWEDPMSWDPGIGGYGYNFEYDANGNMIRDRTKGLIIDYDWRNMPVRFKMYELWNDGSTKVASEVLYDAAGNRVAKFEYNR